jgi:hypothetical protein
VSDKQVGDTSDNRFAWKPEDIEIIPKGDPRLEEGEDGDGDGDGDGNG